MQNAGPSKWYGGMGTSLDGVTLVDEDINPNPANGKQTYTFRSVAGAAVSFRDFNQFRIFDTQSNTLIAVANVPASIMSSVPNTGATGTTVATAALPTASKTSSKTTSTSVTSQQPANGDSKMVSFNGILAALMLVFGF